MTIDPQPNGAARNESGRIVKIIGRLTGALVAFLAIAAFGLSFEALRDLAVVSGGMDRSVAWLFPILMDGGIVVFSLAALRASITGSDKRWYISLVIVVTVFSVGLNIAHAKSGCLPAAIASMPPLLLFLAFESLMRQVHDSLAVKLPVRAVITRVPKPVKWTEASNEVPNPRKVKVLELTEQGWSRSRIARELNMASGTVRKYLGDGASV